MKNRIAAALFLVLALSFLFTSCSIGKGDQRFVTIRRYSTILKYNFDETEYDVESGTYPYTEYTEYNDYTINCSQIDYIEIDWNKPQPSVTVHLISDKRYFFSLEEGKQIYDALGLKMPKQEKTGETGGS